MAKRRLHTVLELSQRPIAKENNKTTRSLTQTNRHPLIAWSGHWVSLNSNFEILCICIYILE